MAVTLISLSILIIQLELNPLIGVKQQMEIFTFTETEVFSNVLLDWLSGNS